MKPILKRTLIFLTTAILSYLLIAIAIWLYNVRIAYTNIQTPLQKYTQQHNAELKDQIFTQLFSDAKTCLTLSSPALQQNCQQAITHHMAVTIKEEELLYDPRGYNWPNDLSFVKQTNNTFQRIRWDGKLTDISSSVNQKTISTPYLIRYLTHQCLNFTRQDENSATCETYTTLPLSNQETGYVVRTVGIDEDQYLDIWIFIFPPFMASQAVTNLLTGNLTDMSLPTLGLTAIILPLLLASLITFLSTKKSNPHKLLKKTSPQTLPKSKNSKKK